MMTAYVQLNYFHLAAAITAGMLVERYITTVIDAALIWFMTRRQYAQRKAELERFQKLQVAYAEGMLSAKEEQSIN